MTGLVSPLLHFRDEVGDCGQEVLSSVKSDREQRYVPLEPAASPVRALGAARRRGGVGAAVEGGGGVKLAVVVLVG